MQPLPWPEPDRQVVAAVKAIYRRKALPLAVQIRDMLGELYPDEEFAEVYGVRGRPGLSPGRLALVSVLQMVEKLTDRQAAEAAGRDLAWKYALGLALDDPGFDHSVLPEFRSRVVAGGLEQHLLDVLLARLGELGLVKAGGKQRTDSTHVISAVRDLNGLELAGESVRAAAEALVAAAPDWFGCVFDAPGWSMRYGRPVSTWRLPTSKAKRDALAGDYGRDGHALLEAVYSASAPAWLRELPAVQVLRVVLLQTYVTVVDAQGKAVIRRRDARKDGIPPAPSRISSPYDTDARWAAKGPDLFWNGYKVHISETCDGPTRPATGDAGRDLERPNIVTNVATADATIADSAMTAPIHAMLAARALTPAEHYLDSGYPSAAQVASARAEHGIEMVTPLLPDRSAQARAAGGFAQSDFTIDFQTKTATCPQGAASSSWTPVRSGRQAGSAVVKFARADCRPCPARLHCTASKDERRVIMVPAPEIYQVQAAARAAQNTQDWQTRYATRAGVEGTISQAVGLGIRRSRYRGIAKTRLHHQLIACAINLIRLNAYWNGNTLDRGRTSHLTRLNPTPVT